MHNSSLEGCSAAHHEKIMAYVRDCLDIDPDELLPKNHHLLHANFCVLGEGSTENREVWLALVDSALNAAHHIRRRQ